MDEIGGHMYFLRYLGGKEETRDKETIIMDLQRVRGIGENLADELYRKGVRSIKDIVKAQGVSDAIRLCARYIDDIEQMIEPKVVMKFSAWLEIVTLQVGLKDRDMARFNDVIPVGSYRRGSVSTHDIDLLVIYRGDNPQPILDKLIGKIEKYANFKGRLSSGKTQYDFLYLLDGYVRVVELYLAPTIEKGAALLHTTGSKDFGIAIRMLAKSKGLLFNQHGLFNRETNVPIARETETFIFTALGLDFIPPTDRGDAEVIESIYSAAKHGKA